MTDRTFAISLLLASAALPLAAAWASAPPPPRGVYSCMGRTGPVTAMAFGILDGRTYATYDGIKGSYSYDQASGVLTMTSGPLAGIKYGRLTPAGQPTDDPRQFRMLDSNGQQTAYMCPKDGNKDPDRHPW